VSQSTVWSGPSADSHFERLFELSIEQRLEAGRLELGSNVVGSFVNAFSGGFSGGTVASMLHMLEAAGRDPEIRRVMAAPYGLNPEGQRTGPDEGERLAPKFDEQFEQWTAPFVMAPINTKVVRRSNALLDHAYGKDFRYDEAILTGKGMSGAIKAGAAAAGTAMMMAGLTLGPLRRLAAKRLPKPGEGPTREQQEKGARGAERDRGDGCRSWETDRPGPRAAHLPAEISVREGLMASDAFGGGVASANAAAPPLTEGVHTRIVERHGCIDPKHTSSPRA
jgi:hypothetical protein